MAFEYSSNNLMWKQAVFFAERLVAESNCDDTNYLLAFAYFHNQEIGRAYWHLKEGNKLPLARYLLAKCCFSLQKWEEAEEALVSGLPGSLAEVVNGAAGLHLLGQVKEKQSKRDQAIECYARALEICPFMWEAYERWSWLILGSPSPSRSSSSTMASAAFSEEKLAQSIASFSSATGGWQQPYGASSLVGSIPLAGRGRQRPVAGGLRTAPQPVQGTPGGSPPRLALKQVAPLATTSGRNEREQQPHHGPPRKERRAEVARLSGHAGAQGNSARDARDPTGSARRGVENGALPTDNVEVSLASLLCQLGHALQAMHSFECGETIRLLSKLPRRHYETGYILELVGICHFESADYKRAKQVFQQVWRIEPRRAEGLEYYSSTLWHLREDIELGHLAQMCLQWDRLKPQVWCVVGNCFSLQKEHDTAIKFFKRAIQVDPSFTYAYTLCGHEFVANEKFDKAIPMYQDALNIDARHYNAWWGLGNIYHRQEDHENARYHFIKALEINKNNSVLRCYLGMVLESLNNPLMALENFDRASQGEPQNGMAYFQKAVVLMSHERHDEALVELKKVRSLAPKEACVHFQLGKVYMKLQKDRKALLHFNTAMDLNRDSKDYHVIKTHIEQLHISQSEEGGRRSGRSSNSGDEREHDGRGGVEREHPPSGTATPQQPSSHRGHAGGGGSGYPAQQQQQQQQQNYGGSSPSSRATSSDLAGGAQPQTPAVARGSYGTAISRSLWSQRGSPGTFHPGRGGSPTSWGGTPGTGGPYPGHAPGFRI